MRTRFSIGFMVLMVLAVACGDGSGITSTSTTEPGTTTATTATTPTSAQPNTAPATTAEPTSATEATTPRAEMTTVGAAVADVEAWLAGNYASSDPPPGVLGPSKVVCALTGPIPVGSVLACSLEPDTAPDFQLDEGGIVIYVLDADGHTAWSAGSDVPDSTTALAQALALAGTDLMCRDLMDPDVMAYPFSGVGRPVDSAYFWSLVYWSLAGQPDRMDADLNGIPCETLHDAAIVSQVLAGGPVS